MRRGGRGEEQRTKRCGLGQETGTAKWLSHTEARQAGVREAQHNTWAGESGVGAGMPARKVL